MQVLIPSHNIDHVLPRTRTIDWVKNEYRDVVPGIADMEAVYDECEDVMTFTQTSGRKG